MSTILGSNNAFPSVLLTEGTTPTTPATGKQRLFARSSDGHLCTVDDAGTVTDLQGTSGDVVGPASAVDERIAVFDGATGKLIKDGGTTIAAITAGAGATISTTAVGSEPGSPSSGDLDFYSNGFNIVRYSGSAWVPWGPIFPFTAPSLSAPTTWVNQGGASVDTTYGGIYLTAPAGAGDNIRARVKTAPATPYVVTAAFLMNYPAVNYPSAGLLFRDSASGKIATLSFGASATYYSLGVSKFTNATTFSANYTAVAWWSASSPVWLRIADNGVSRICSYSADGQHWQVLHTIGRTDFLTADQVGFYANANNATYPADLTLLSWKET